MRILSNVKDSILWQKAENSDVRNAILNIAKKYNVEDRIIFAKNTASVDLHLYRAGLADLALDSLIYNGHTITADMLWAGVPVITCKGYNFASRVSSSLLNSIGLNDCVANSIKEMEDIAIDLGNNKSKISELKRRLKNNKNIFPLFDTERYSRHFEIAMKMMLEKNTVDHIDVPALPKRENVFNVQQQKIENDNNNVQIESYNNKNYNIYFEFCPICECYNDGNLSERYFVSSTHSESQITSEKYWLFCKNCNHFYSDSFFDSFGNSIFEKTFLEYYDCNYDELIKNICKFDCSEKESWVVVDPKNINFILNLINKNFKPIITTKHDSVYNQALSIKIDCIKGDIINTGVYFKTLSLFNIDYYPFPDLIFSRIYNLMNKDSVFHFSVREFDYSSNLLEYKEICDPFRIHMYSKQNIEKLISNYDLKIAHVATDPLDSFIKHYILIK
jgi:hypothetical protein